MRKEVDREEQELRAMPPDMFLPANVFNAHVGHFWGITETRPYMRARYGLIEAILKLKTFDAAQSALDDTMDLLRLCRSDNMGVRSLVPPLLLRLGTDQACYDFVKWWAKSSYDNHYDWGDLSNPYLDIKDADLTEDVEYMCGSFPNLSHIVSLTLVKIRLLLALKDCLQECDVLSEGGKLPTELVDSIQDSLLRKTAVGGREDIKLG